MKTVTYKLECYQDIADMMRGSLAKCGRNQNDEIVFCEYKAQTPEDDKHYELRTYQKNSRIRVNKYYSDRITTETFEDSKESSEL